MDKLNPKTGRPVKTTHNWYGRRMSARTKINIRAKILNLPDSAHEHKRKPCYLMHRFTKQPVQFTCVSDACHFLEIQPMSSTRQNMVRRGYHGEWYFCLGVYQAPPVPVEQFI